MITVKEATVKRGPSTHLHLVIPDVAINCRHPIDVELMLQPIEEILLVKGIVTVTELANQYHGRILSGTFSHWRPSK